MGYICNLTGAKYSLVEFNALDMKNYFINIDKLTKLDIVSGYAKMADSQPITNLRDEFYDATNVKIISKAEFDQLLIDGTVSLDTDEYMLNKRGSSCSTVFNNLMHLNIRKLTIDYPELLDKELNEFSDIDILTMVNLQEINCYKVIYEIDSSDDDKLFGRPRLVRKQSTEEKAVEVRKLLDSCIKLFYNSKKSFYNMIESSIIVLEYKDGRYYLIDGYRRLFLTEDELLNINIPIKIYFNLSDSQYIQLLNLCNWWKYNHKYSMNSKFYDRGYLYSLRSKYNIDYRQYSNIDLVKIMSYYNAKSYNSCFVSDILSLKDFNLTKYNYLNDKLAIELIHWLGELRAEFLNSNEIDATEMFNTICDKFDKELSHAKDFVNPGRLDSYIDKLKLTIVEEMKLFIL